MNQVTLLGGEGEPDMASAHSFLLRFWLEPSPPKTNRQVWRGHITHVMSRARRPIEELDDILSFVKPYLSAHD
jgi:hypothetical protein